MSKTENEKLCDDFRHLLTHGFYATPYADDDTPIEGDEEAAKFKEDALTITKPWRNDLWHKFVELEDRLCPGRKLARRAKKIKEKKQ